jgi:uncharacterized protein YqjF (DUF2071 family)
VSIVAFRIAGARLRGVPRALAWPAFPEVNVRTYVSGGGHAGVWFFSLDAGSRWAVEGGRRGIHLPYFRAFVATSFGEDGASYRLERTHPGEPDARLIAQATGSGGVHAAVTGTLEHWLAERYCFFTSDAHGRTRRGDVLHEPWPLRLASADIDENTLLSAAGIEPSGKCLAHLSSGVSTRAWPLR